MTRNLSIWRWIVSFCLAVVLAGAAAAATFAAPAGPSSPALAVFQDDDDDDDDDGDDGGYDDDDDGVGGVSGLPATGAGTTAAAPNAVFQDDDDDDDGDDDDRDGVSGLPSTGAGTAAGRSRATYQDDDDGGDQRAGGRSVAIHTGSCAAFDPAPAVVLTDAAPRGGDDDLAASATEIERSLDDLLTRPHVIAVMTESGAACGALAGAVVDDTLVVGLQAANGSGWTGVAIFEADDDDDLDVTVYLFPSGSAPAPTSGVTTGDDDGDDD